jgi:hypothetical protein
LNDARRILVYFNGKPLETRAQGATLGWTGICDGSQLHIYIDTSQKSQTQRA